MRQSCGSNCAAHYNKNLKKEGIILYYVNLKQQKILEDVNKFGSMTYEQIKKINDLKDIDKHLKTLIRHNKLKVIEENIYVPMGKRKVNNKILKALDVCIYLNSIDNHVPIEWCNIENFPFTFVFFRNNKVFDITVIDEGEELIYSQAINRSAAERIIVILDKLSQVEKMKINKQAKYCTIKDGAVIFLQKGDE